MASTPMHYTPADSVTGKAQGKVTQGTFVMIAGEMDGRNPVIMTATADARVFGVAAHDAAEGEYVTVYRTGMYQLAANGSINPGDAVSTHTAGQAKKAADGPVVGLAMSKATGGVVTVALA